MPTYDYDCAGCGAFDALRTVSQRNDPAACPQCSAASPRIFANAPALALLDGGMRNAIATNERASHEPTRSRDTAVRLRHPSGCGCCTGVKRGATVQAASGNKAFPSRRPWMISH